MKKRKLEKKLSLNKKTVAHLNHDSMKVLHGGERASYPNDCHTPLPAECPSLPVNTVCLTICVPSECHTICGGHICL
jgi:hypothetical protein